jgi:hypothetical protein
VKLDESLTSFPKDRRRDLGLRLTMRRMRWLCGHILVPEVRLGLSCPYEPVMHTSSNLLLIRRRSVAVSVNHVINVQYESLDSVVAFFLLTGLGYLFANWAASVYDVIQ